MKKIIFLFLILSNLLFSSNETDGIIDYIDHPAHSNGLKGFQDYGDIDNINLFNGNVNLSIPLGPSYQVGPILTYQLKIFYNSNIWRSGRFAYPSNSNNCPTSQTPFDPACTPRFLIKSYIGSGWKIGIPLLSKLSTSQTLSAKFISYDGSEYNFTGGDADNAYTFDSSYLKLVKINNTYFKVLTGDGIIYEFQNNVCDDPEPTGVQCHNYPTKISDSYGNCLIFYYIPGTRKVDKISYKTKDMGTNPEVDIIKFIYETYTIPNDEYIDFDEDNLAPFDDNISERISQIQFRDNNGNWVSYSFNLNYQIIKRPKSAFMCFDSSCNRVNYAYVTAPFLSSLSLPDGTSYSFNYYISTSSYPSEEMQGRLYEYTIPTGGKIKYDYDTTLRTVHISGDNACNENDERISAITSVSRKTYYDKDNNEIGHIDYIYETQDSDPSTPGVDPNPEEEYTIVKVYQGGSLISHKRYTFSAGIYEAPRCSEISPSNVGVDYGDLKQIDILDENENILKSTFYTYDWDQSQCNGCRKWHRNKRILNTTEKTYKTNGFDKISYCNVNYDNYGHYRITNIYDGECYTGNLKKTIETNWTPKLTYWILNIYDYKKVYLTNSNSPSSFSKYYFNDSTGFLIAQCDYKNISANINEPCLEGPDLKIDKDYSIKTPKYSIKKYYVDTNLDGNPDYVEIYDKYNEKVFEPNFKIHNIYTYGVLIDSKYQKKGYSGWTDYTWNIFKQDINQYTLLPIYSYDITSQPNYRTFYQYDNMFRISTIDPPSTEIPITIDYLKDTSNFFKGIKIQRPDNNDLAETILDDFGRVKEEKKVTPQGIVKRCHLYNILGRETFISSWYSNDDSSACENHSGTYTTYDFLGRIKTVQITGAQHPITYTYNGERERIIERYFMSESRYEKPSKTYETYDALGRLIQTEVKDEMGQRVGPIAYYSYDLNNNLLTVSIYGQNNGNYTTQIRNFTYDMLGRLTYESHPEGKIINYDGYDGLGNVTKKKVFIGNGYWNYFTYIYDYAGRLIKTKVKPSNYSNDYPSSDPNVACSSSENCFILEELTYDAYSVDVKDINGNLIQGGITTGSNNSYQGKLVMAKRNNYFETPQSTSIPPFYCDYSKGSITDIYTYYGLNGRLSERRLYSEYFAKTDNSKIYFKWNYNYDQNTGLLNQIRYPEAYNINNTLFDLTPDDKDFLNINYSGTLPYIQSMSIGNYPIVSNITYDSASGNPYLVNYGDGMTTVQYDYDSHNRLFNIYGYSAYGDVFKELTMQYDSSSNLYYWHNAQTIIPIIEGPIIIGPGKPLPPRPCRPLYRNFNSYYDELNQIKEHSIYWTFSGLNCPPSSTTLMRWGYDDFSNIDYICQGGGDNIPCEALELNISKNQLNNYIYNGRGSVFSTQDLMSYYYYDIIGGMNDYLEKSTNPNQLSVQHLFGYNWKDERVANIKYFIVPMISTDERCINSCFCYDKDPSKSEWSQATIYIRDEAGQVLAEFDMDIDQSGTKWWGMQRYNYNLFGKNIAADITGEDIEQTRAIDIATSRRYYFHDHLGSVRVIANQYGEPIYNFEYWPFGEEFTSSEYNEGTYRYTGHERDYDLGLDYMMSRHYSWKYGRFLQPDPVNGSIGNPQRWNLYSYVSGNPVNFNDPSGTMERWQGLGKAIDPYPIEPSTGIDITEILVPENIEDMTLNEILYKIYGLEKNIDFQLKLGDVVIRYEPGTTIFNRGYDVARILKIEEEKIYIGGYESQGKGKNPKISLVEMGGEKEAYRIYKIMGSFTPKAGLITSVIPVEKAIKILNVLTSQGYVHGTGGNKYKQLECFQLTNKLTYKYRFTAVAPSYSLEWYLNQLR